jgi:type III secretory pathway component EscU
MELPPNFYVILALFVVTLLINLPFGYARAKTKRYCFRWFLYIHVPIPLIFVARTISHIEMKYIPIFALAALIGQVLGGRLEL